MYFNYIRDFFSGQMIAKDFSRIIMDNFIITSDGEIDINTPGLSASEDTGNRLQITNNDIVKLCDSVISENVHPYCLISIGLMINMLPEFVINIENDYRAHIVTNEWGEHGYYDIEMKKDNILAWKEYMQTGISKVQWKFIYK